MPPDSDAEDYDVDIADMEEVVIENDIPPDDEDDVIDGVEDLGLMEQEAEIIDDAIGIIELHEASVFSIDVARNDSCLVVSGGEDDKAFVWNYKTAECLFECTGHKDSVVSCGFSSDGKYVMSADMAGNVRVFAAATGQHVWEYECEDLEWCLWHPSAHVLFAGMSGGDVYMWKVPSGDCKIYPSHGSKTTIARITSNGKEIVTAYEDGSVKKWDLKSVNVLFHYKPAVSDEGDVDPVLCLDLLNIGAKNGNLVVFGTENGNVSLLNSHSGKQICTFSLSTSRRTEGGGKNTENENDMEEEEEEEEEMEEPSNAVESVAFSPCGCYVAAASVNATLCIWDISLQRLRHRLDSPAGLTKLIWTEVEPNIISSSLDGVIRLWDYKKGEIVQEICGHVGNILDMVVTSDGKHLLTAGDDCTARLFEK